MAGLLLMTTPAKRIALVLLAFLAGSAALPGQTPEAKSKLGKQVSSVAEKRFERSTWRGGKQRSPLGKKSFHMKEYNKHYSSLGSRKASSDFHKKVDRKAYDSPGVVTHKRVSRKMSGWSRRLSDVSKPSRIETGQEADLLRERRFYQAILQDTPQAYADLAEKLSMKEINRFAFRRNRSPETPEATAAGQEAAAR